MLDWYLDINRLLREMRKKVDDILAALTTDRQDVSRTTKEYLKTDFVTLQRIWESKFPREELGHLARHLGFGEIHDYVDILKTDIPLVEAKAEAHLREGLGRPQLVGFEDLLHPVILEHTYQQYRDGHLRDAVLNAFVALFDLIRERSGLDLDGEQLINEAFSLNHAMLAFSEVDTESGKNEQKGFIQILKGAYQGIRNPKAHSLNHDLDSIKAAQYLVFASLLARRVSESVRISSTSEEDV